MTRRHKKIRDKVVAITGGARGIGKATGEAFLRAGARVALGDIDIELVEKTAGELAELTGGDVCGVALDVTSRKAFAAFLDNVEARVGPLDVLVNNAGIMPTGLFIGRAAHFDAAFTGLDPRDRETYHRRIGAG